MPRRFRVRRWRENSEHDCSTKPNVRGGARDEAVREHVLRRGLRKASLPLEPTFASIPVLLCTTGLNFHIEAEFHFYNFNSHANPSGIFQNPIIWLFLKF